MSARFNARRDAVRAAHERGHAARQGGCGVQGIGRDRPRHGWRGRSLQGRIHGVPARSLERCTRPASWR